MKKLLLFSVFVLSINIAFSLTNGWYGTFSFATNPTSLTNVFTNLTFKSIKVINKQLAASQKMNAIMQKNADELEKSSQTDALSNSSVISSEDSSMFFVDTAGDYRSKPFILPALSLPWEAATSWEVWNGNNWAAASNYPGQVAGNYSVTIRAGHTITIEPPSSSSFIFTPQEMGDLTINGKLVLGDGQNNGQDNGTRRLITLTTDKIIIGSSGELNFNNKIIRVTLPNPNSVITVIGGTPPVGGKITSSFTCDRDKELYIWDSLYAICGSNNPNNTTTTFGQVVIAGGTINAEITNPITNPTDVYGAVTISLSGRYIGADTNVSYLWTVRDPNNNTSTSSGVLANNTATTSTQFTPTVPGEYLVSLKITTSNSSFSNTETRTFNVLDCSNSNATTAFNNVPDDGFGDWIFTDTGSSGHFTGSSTNNGNGDQNGDGDINSSGTAWGLFANSGQIADMRRPFDELMGPGSTFSIQMDNGFIESGGNVGFGLRNSAGNNLIEFYFRNGQANYKLNALDNETDTGIGFTDEGLKIDFTLVTQSTVSIVVTQLFNGIQHNFTKTLKNPAGGQLISQLRMFNANAGFNGERNAYFNKLVTCVEPVADADGDGFTADIDCNDNNDDIFPGATELCDGIDNDCSGTVDDNVATADSSLASLTLSEVVLIPTFNPSVLSYTSQVCNAISSVTIASVPTNTLATVTGNGTFALSEGVNTQSITVNACGINTVYSIQITRLAPVTYYADTDGDTFGDPDVSLVACSQPANYVLNNADCNDSNAAINPNAQDVCDGIDNNCNGQTDENPAQVDFANLQFPGSATICLGDALTAFGQVYEPGVTPGIGIQGAGIDVEFGYNTTNNNPSEWGIWFDAGFNSLGGGNNNDEYQFTFTPPALGTYYYTFRYSLNGCDWQYGGFDTQNIQFDEDFWDGTNDVSGVLTVVENHTLSLFSGNTNQNLCPNTSITPIDYNFGGGATSISVSNLPTGVSFNPTTGIISGVPTQSGTFNYTVSTNGNQCTSQQLTGTITVKQLLDYANLQFPGSASICAGGSIDAYGQVYELGVTEADGAGTGIVAQLGYGINSSPTTWVNWSTANYHGQGGTNNNNDEYKGTFGSTLSVGTYYYTYRYSLDGCEWQYGGYTSNGGGFLGGSNVVGVLTVNSAPVITNNYANINVNTDANTCGASVSYAPATTTGTPATSISYSTPSGSLFSVGTTTVTVTATNGCGTDIKTFTVTVSDNQAPSFVCENITVPLDASGNASINASQLVSSSSDNCGIASITASKTMFNCNDVTASSTSTSKVVISQIYGGGGNSGATYRNDFIELFNSGTTTVNLSGWSVQYASSTGTSWLKTDLTNFNLQSGQYYLIAGASSGSAGVTLPTSNASGTTNMSATTGKVLLANTTTAQTGTCPTGSQIVDFVRFGTGTSNCAGTTSTAAPSNTTSVIRKMNGCQDTDNNSVDFQVSTTAPRNTSSTLAPCSSGPTGTPVILTVTDVNGNVTQCTAYVTVVDNVAPTVACKNITVQLAANGTATIAEDAINNGSSDACGGLTFDTDKTTFNCSNVGPNTVTLTVTDVNDISATCTAIVTVEDTVAPTAICKNLTVQLNANGIATIAEEAVNNGSSDACGGLTFDTDITSFDCSNVGPNTVILTVTDVNGNSATCSATVTVEDNVLPNAICQDITVQLDASGNAIITAAQIDNGSNDACGIASISIDETSFDCSDLASAPIINDLFISEYVEGGSFNKCIELYNGTGANIDLGGNNYQLLLYSNGSSTVSASISLSGIISNGDVYVICHSDAINSFVAEADATNNTVINFNGDDAIVLVKSGNPIDVFGKIGQDPGTAWTVGSNSTLNRTLVRNPNVISGNTANATGFPSLGTEWTEYPQDNSSFIGSHGVSMGGVPVTLTVTDNNGNVSTCTATVTVEDNVNPTAVTQNITVELNASGNVSILPEDVDDGSNDACGIQSLTLSQIDFNCNHVGPNTVTLTVTDNNDNVSTATATVTVNDVTPAQVITQDISIDLDANGDTSIVPSDVDNGSDDACGIESMTVSPNTFDCSNVGPNTVTLTVVDVNGNTSSATATVTVNDVTPAQVITQDISIDLDANGDASIVPSDVDNGSNDACGIESMTVSPNTFDCSNVGPNTVTLTVVDVNGNSSSGTATVTISDNLSPEIVCVVEDTLRDTDPGVCTYTVQGAEFDATFSDNCDSASITNDYNNSASLDGAVFPKGSTSVNWLVDDGNGQTATCTTVITVEDNEAPIVNCLSLQVQLDEFGNGSIAIEDIDGDSTDNCGIASITISQTDFDCSDIGGDLDKLIISEYSDGTGNNDCIEIYNGTGNDINLFTENYTLKFYLNGSSTPTIVPLLGTIADRDVYVICNPFGPGAGQADQTGAFGIDGNDAIALVHNNVAVDIFGVIGNNPGSGWTSGSVSTAGTTLVRNENVLQGNINAFVANLESEWTPYANVGNLGSHTIEITNLANNVILTVTDTNGNVSTCEGNVTVIDAVAPEALCQNVTIYLDANGNASTSASAVDNGSNDACGIAALELSQTNFTCANVGPNEVTLTVTDSNGNEATCTATVTVVDDLAPVVNTQDITVQLDANGNVSITPNQVDDNSSDNCDIATLSVSPNSFTCANVGENTVTLTVIDVNGNPASGTAVVTVQDNVAPIATCNAITVQLDALGAYVLTQDDFNAIGSGSSDACGIASMTAVPNSFTCDDIGANTVTLTVTDVNGNSSICTATVTVEGIIPDVTISEGPLPEFCQGAVVVLTANSAEAIAYEWTTGETTQNIEVAGNGTYGVTVTSATNCTTYVEYTVTGFDAGDLISSYTILASDEVFLQGSNLVQSGAVGATTPGTGKIRLFQASNVVDFAQASNIQLMQGSTVGTAIYQPATPTIPTFIVNNQSTSSSPDATVNVNQTQTLNESVYDVVDIKQGATVTFSASNVYINSLITSQDATIEFAGCANVFINNKFTLAKNGTINANGNNVVFYVNDDIQIEKGSNVRARMHSNGNELLAKGENANGNNAAEPTYMTGLFIAKKVHGSLNVIWAADTLCEPCALPGAPAPSANNPDYPRLFDFEIVSWPNPSDNVFNLKLKTEDYSSKAQIKVFDMNNKLVHVSEFEPTDVYRFGNELQSGVYIVKVVQAKNTASVRVVKY